MGFWHITCCRGKKNWRNLKAVIKSGVLCRDSHHATFKIIRSQFCNEISLTNMFKKRRRIGLINVCFVLQTWLRLGIVLKFWASKPLWTFKCKQCFSIHCLMVLFMWVKTLDFKDQWQIQDCCRGRRRPESILSYKLITQSTIHIKETSVKKTARNVCALKQARFFHHFLVLREITCSAEQ